MSPRRRRWLRWLGRCAGLCALALALAALVVALALGTASGRARVLGVLVAGVDPLIPGRLEIDRLERLDPFARLVRVDVGQLGRQPVADDRELLTSGSHGVASPSAVSRAAGRPRERIPRCVVQTNRRTNWPIAHLYLTVTGSTEGFAPRLPLRPCDGAVSRRNGGGFAEGGPCGYST